MGGVHTCTDMVILKIKINCERFTRELVLVLEKLYGMSILMHALCENATIIKFKQSALLKL